MASFVALHGAWHWGACFGKVATELQAAGHSVAMPDLAAHGFNASAPGEVETMAQYTASARRVIEAAPGKVILIGHSLGGASCTFLGEQMADKVEALIYVCAWLAPAGKAPIEYIQSDAYQHSPWTVEINQLIAPGSGGLNLETGDADLLKRAFYADCSDHDMAVARRNLVHCTPFAPFTTPSATTGSGFGRLRRIYIECTEDRAIPIDMQRQMQSESAGSEVLTMNTSHSPYLSAPGELARLILGCFGA